MDIVYIGYSDTMFELLMSSHNYEIKKIVYVEARVSEKYKRLLNNSQIDTLNIKTKEDVQKIEKFIDSIKVVLMYKFEYILPQKLIEAHRIFNFHGGSLKTNRGPHAVVRSIINCDKETVLPMYELTGGIDVGLLIGEYRVAISLEETVKSLNAKLQKGIPKLLALLREYLQGDLQGVLIEDGKYYSKITKADYTLDLEKDSFEKMGAILRSQRDYFGAICYMQNLERRVKDWKEEETTENSNRKICLEENRIIVEDGKRKLILYL